MTQIPSLQELLEAGLHFGHQVKRWHPAMSQYIYGKRDNIHIIDLTKTRAQLEKAADFLKSQAQEGKVIMFVGTKRQAQEIIRESAESANSPYISNRWIGGLITNWEQNKRNIDKINRFTEEKATGKLGRYTKKEQLLMERKIHKLMNELGGVVKLSRTPDVLVIIDPKKEMNAVLEAKRQGIPVVALCDTNTNPMLVTYPIPGNDDSMKSLKLIISTLSSAISEGAAKAAKDGVSISNDKPVITQEPVIKNIEEVIETVVEEIEGKIIEEEEQEKQKSPEQNTDDVTSSLTQSAAEKVERKSDNNKKADALTDDKPPKKQLEAEAKAVSEVADVKKAKKTVEKPTKPTAESKKTTKSVAKKGAK